MMNYKGYVARTEIDPETGLIFGEVLGLRDMITFQGYSGPEVIRAFHESVDLYLETCAEQGVEPERAYSGAIAVRTTPRVHRDLMILASARGLSLNELVGRVLAKVTRQAGLGRGVRAGSSQSPAPVRKASKSAGTKKVATRKGTIPARG